MTEAEVQGLAVAQGSPRSPGSGKPGGVPGRRAPRFGRHPFPRPHREEDIEILEAKGLECRLTRREIFELVVSPEAREWPTPARNEQSLRVLLSGDWVLKARPAHRHPDLAYQRILLEESVRLTRRLDIWHPAKEWFLLAAHGEFWLCNATPRLKTHRDLTSWPQKLVFGLLQTLMTVGLFLKERVTLDPKTRNFGYVEKPWNFYYLDDEVYRYDGMSAILLGQVVTLPLRDLPPSRWGAGGG